MKTFPLMGVGAKNYTLVNSIYKNRLIDQAFTGRVNNSYIQIATEKGIVGLGVYGFILLIFIYNSSNKILKTVDTEEKTIAIIIFVSVLAILIRELFFSSIFYNNDILLLLFIFFIINSDNSIEFLVPSKYKYPIIILAFSIFSIVIFFYTEQFKNRKLYDNYISNFNNENFDSAINYINKTINNSKSNALYESCLGLTLERKMSKIKDFDFIEEFGFTPIDRELLTRSISKYKRACDINPYDAFYLNNLGWLYFMENQTDSAINCISKAITIDPTIALFHISKGLMIEKDDVEMAFAEYKSALILSPDILDSRFFNNLKNKFSEKSSILINQVYNELHILQKQKNSPIIKARMGKVMLELNKVDSAYYIFKEVTSELPNLNRPWYYLGLICEKKGMTIDMLVYYQKSIYLDFKDYLPKYELAKYYDGVNDVRNAQYYHRITRKCWSDKLSEHSFRSKKIYYLETVKDDIIPNGFYQYIIPDTLLITQKFNSN
jgi:tetratricopeptide (TPR) repeat protein